MRKILILPMVSIFILAACVMAWANDLGVKEGKLLPCPKAPHCVSTQSADLSHKIEPFEYTQDKATVHQALVKVLQTMRGAKLISLQDDYLHAEFRSAILRFVDDLEVYFDPGQKIIHFRSASRVGYFDFGVNRLRVEKLKDNLQAVLKNIQ